jgi:D-arabinose 1-dehydrogenase-like Zn-dependent alcohol dehydrogenase
MATTAIAIATMKVAQVSDSEDTLRFVELTGVRPMIETYPLEKAAEAYARMMSGKAEFRVVLTM